MASDEAAALIELLRAMPSIGGDGLEPARAALEAGGGAPIDDDTTVTELTLAGRPAETITAGAVAEAATNMLLYLHGGGYCLGSLDTHRRLAANLSRAAGVAVITLDYRLAPEHPYPAALDDATAAYRTLLDDGRDPATLAIGGDSAGGGLSLATLISLRDAGDPLPRCGVLLSPWSDLTLSGQSHRSRAEADPLIDAAAMEALRGWYLGQTSPDDPLASPLLAELAGLPPLLVDCGDAEVLLDDSVRLAVRLGRAGVEVDHRVWSDMPHVFWAFAGMAPEADEGMARIGRFLNDRLRS